MAHLNIKIKAQCEKPEHIRQVLEECSAAFKGVDHLIDTYFNVPKGRLKLRHCVSKKSRSIVQTTRLRFPGLAATIVLVPDAPEIYINNFSYRRQNG